MAMPRLEIFDGGAAPRPGLVVLDTATLEGNRESAWQEGYKAGRDEARLSETSAAARHDAALLQGLAALTLNLPEARALVMTGIAPVLTQVLQVLLPAMARESLAPLLREQLLPLIEEGAAQPIRLILHPMARPRINALLATFPELSLRLEEDETLDEAELRLCPGEAEINLNLSRSIAEITRLMRDFFPLTQESQDV